MRYKEPDTYGEPKIMKFPGMTANIYHPILSPEERERRMKEIYKAAAVLIASQERSMREQEEKS